MVLNTEPLPEKARPTAPRGHRMRKARVAEVEVARDCDLGHNDNRAHAISHLGHILRAGDTVLGYQVSTANLADGEANSLLESLPDVVLVRKVYPRNRDGDGESSRTRDRHWKLGELETDGGGDGGAGSNAARDEAAAEKDREHFLQQLESDKDMRRQVNLYKSSASPAAAGEDAGEEADEEQITLEELLDGMTLDNAGAGPDGDGENVGAEASIFEAGNAPALNAALPSLDDDPDL